MLSKKIKILAGVVIALIFIALVEKYYGWPALLKPWQQLSYLNIAISLTIVFFSYWLRALRVFDYFRDRQKINQKIKLLGTFRLILLHNFFNNFIPMRAGEASFPILMQRYYNIPLSRSGPALAWFRLLDLHTLLLLGLIIFGKYFLGTTITMVLAIPFLLLPIFIQKFNQVFLIFLSRRPNSEKKRGLASSLVITTLQNFPRDNNQFYRSWCWTLLNWLVKISVFSWVLIQFIDINYLVAWIGVIAGDLTSVLPIHGFAGAGTYEAGVIAAMLPFGVNATDGLLGAVNLHLFLLGATILGALVGLMIPRTKKPVDNKASN